MIRLGAMGNRYDQSTQIHGWLTFCRLYFPGHKHARRPCHQPGRFDIE